MPRGTTLTADERTKRDADKAAKFKELAPLYMNKAIYAIRRIANLASSNYVSDRKQSDKMIKALRDELGEVEAVFAGAKDQVKVGFTLDDDDAAPAGEND